MPLQDGADCPPVDAEPVAQLVDRRYCLIALDELLRLLVIELPRPAWLWPYRVMA